MFNERFWEILLWEILLPPLGLMKDVHDLINSLYYNHWTDKWKYIPYISVTRKVLTYLSHIQWSKMTTLEHDLCDVHRASSLYMKSSWQSLYRVFPTGGGVPPPTKNLLIHPLPNEIFILSHQKSIQPNKIIKTSFLAVVIALVPFLF